MIKKIFIILLLVAIPLVVLFYFLRDKVGDIAPAVLPPGQNLPEAIRQAQQTGETPGIPLHLAEGFQIGVFAESLPNARDLEFSPEGILLVSLPAEGRVVALPDKNNDGVADENRTVLNSLRRPHGLSFHNGDLFVAEETQVSRYSFDEETYEARLEKKLFDLPSGGRHRTRSIDFDKDGNLYVSLGSTCDTCIEEHPFIGTVIISNPEGEDPKVYSRGLRNAVFITAHPETGQIWATEMGRDFLGDETPPDEVNILTQNGNFGWPFCYGDKIWDRSFGRQNQAFCNGTIAPFYKIPAHSAPLGLTFITSGQFPDDWQNDLLVAYHGSWNRSEPTGYKIVRIKTEGTPSESDFITGFLSNGNALGRPVDVVFDTQGSLYVSDDKEGAVYKVVSSS